MLNFTTETKAKIEADLAAIDSLITAQLNEILHHPKFKELEATWRGLHYLVNESSSAQQVKIKILDVRKNELLKDFERANEFEESTLFQKVYQDIYTVRLAEPFSLLIGVYEFGSGGAFIDGGKQIYLLEQISKVAAFAHTPFISMASPNLLGLGIFEDIIEIRLKGVSKGLERGHLEWHKFRKSESSRYVGLCLPHILLRDPYILNKPFNFQESLEANSYLIDPLLWGNSAFAFGACVARAYNEKSWLGKMRGNGDDGEIKGLYFQSGNERRPYYSFLNDWEKSLIHSGFSLDAKLLDWAEDISQSGLIPLIDPLFEDEPILNPYVFDSSSTHDPIRFDTETANANSRAWAKLDYIFAVSRFAIYLMCIERDRVGGFMNRAATEIFLNRWISQYVIDRDNSSEEAQARQPLREALVNVSELPGQSSRYKAIVFLRPIYQLDEMPIAMRIVVNLPAPVIGD